MNKPNPYDRPEEPKCDACDGKGTLIPINFGNIVTVPELCILCNGTGTLSEAAQREIAEETKAERKDWRNA